MKILLATNNPHKISEFERLIEGNHSVRLLSPNDLNISGFIPTEEGDEFEDNAFSKAEAFFNKTKIPSIADDSGLCVDYLNGEPGVRSARFAGENATDGQNVMLLLEKMNGVTRRSAYFKCVICYYDGIGVVYAEGTVRGTIAEAPAGGSGFGYDPVFIPDGYHNTFAELGDEVKNKISHRAKALASLKEKILKRL